MRPDLHDKTWMGCGISMLWDAEALNEICAPGSVRSLREFLRLYHTGWPEDALNLINSRTLVIAGLEAAMDTLNPLEAVEWLEIHAMKTGESSRDEALLGRIFE